MASGSDDLRAILDRRAGPEKSKEERKYYESMMRRLGYGEAEMAAFAARAAQAAPVVEEPEPEPVPEPVDATPRVIEFEYGGAEEIPEFEPVRAKAHPTELAQTEFDIGDVNEGVEDSDYELAGAEPAYEEPAAEDDEFVLLEPETDDAEFEAVAEPEEELVDFVEFSEVPVDDDWEGAVDESEEEIEEWEEIPEPVATPRGHVFNGFTLYRRDLDGGQHVYFYSKKEPADAEPAPVPEGYGTKVSNDTGVPYLARLRDGAEAPAEPEPELEPIPITELPEDEPEWDPVEEWDSAPVEEAYDDGSGVGFSTVEASTMEEAMEIARKRGLKFSKVVPVEMEDDE